MEKYFIQYEPWKWPHHSSYRAEGKNYSSKNIAYRLNRKPKSHYLLAIYMLFTLFTFLIQTTMD